MKFCICVLLLFPLLSFAQKKDTVLKYLDSNLQPTNEKNVVYFGVAIKKKEGWLLYALYPDTTPVIQAWFKDKQLKIKNGPYTVYYPKRVVAENGYYTENKMNGVWQSWHPNGEKKDSGLMKNDQLVGLWKEWYLNGRLKYECEYREESFNLASQFSDAYFGIKNGNFTSWYENGNLESTGFYKNDVMNEEWKWFHSNGNASTIEKYKEGKIISLQCFDTTGKEVGEFCSIAKPALLKGFGDYKEYIFKNLLWPEEAVKKNIEGSVKVRFTVNKNGTLENLVLETDQEILKKGVEELFESMKEWYPAVSHNRAIDWEEEMTIPFYRNK
jgi:TonB family protein